MGWLWLLKVSGEEREALLVELCPNRKDLGTRGVTGKGCRPVNEAERSSSTSGLGGFPSVISVEVTWNLWPRLQADADRASPLVIGLTRRWNSAVADPSIFGELGCPMDLEVSDHPVTFDVVA